MIHHLSLLTLLAACLPFFYFRSPLLQFLFHNPPAGTGLDCRQAGLAAGQFPLYVCRMRFGFCVTEKSNTFSKKKKKKTRLKKLHMLFSVNVALTDVVIPASSWMLALNFVPITSRMSCFQQVFDGAARQRSLCLRPSLMKRRQRRFFRSFMACSWARALISTSESCVSVMLCCLKITAKVFSFVSVSNEVF